LTSPQSPIPNVYNPNVIAIIPYKGNIHIMIFMVLCSLYFFEIRNFRRSQPTAGVTGAGMGVDSAWEQRKLEARKMFENAPDSPASSARFVGRV
jgi:hypothetical protein